jgi:hypothetical protein
MQQQQQQFGQHLSVGLVVLVATIVKGFVGLSRKPYMFPPSCRAMIAFGMTL